MYECIWNELAKKYAVDINEQGVRDGRTLPSPCIGRGTAMGMKTVPLNRNNQGIAAGNRISNFYRRLNARGRQFLLLEQKRNRNATESNALMNLIQTLPIMLAKDREAPWL